MPPETGSFDVIVERGHDRRASIASVVSQHIGGSSQSISPSQAPPTRDTIGNRRPSSSIRRAVTPPLSPTPSRTAAFDWRQCGPTQNWVSSIDDDPQSRTLNDELEVATSDWPDARSQDTFSGFGAGTRLVEGMLSSADKPPRRTDTNTGRPFVPCAQSDRLCKLASSTAKLSAPSPFPVAEAAKVEVKASEEKAVP